MLHCWSTTTSLSCQKLLLNLYRVRIFKKSQRLLLQILSYILCVCNEFGVSKKSGKLDIDPFCSFHKLAAYEIENKLEFHKSLTI